MFSRNWYCLGFILLSLFLKASRLFGLLALLLPSILYATPPDSPCPRWPGAERSTGIVCLFSMAENWEHPGHLYNGLPYDAIEVTDHPSFPRRSYDYNLRKNLEAQLELMLGLPVAERG